MPTSVTGQIIFFMLLLLIGASLAGLYLSTPAQARVSATGHDTRALQEAKEALLGYALMDANLPGRLPCPATDGDGIARNLGTQCATYLGLLPWKTLGLSDLRDASGECLWYGLSQDSLFRSALPATARTASTALNGNTPGLLRLQDSQSPALQSQIVAFIFAPGAPIGAQSRLYGATAPCHADGIAAHYLDRADGIDNALSASNAIGVLTNPAEAFNDRLLALRQAEWAGLLAQRVAIDLKAYPGKGLTGFLAQQHRLPCAAPTPGGLEGSSNAGYLPLANLDFDAATQTWISRNNWPALLRYQVSPSCHQSGPLTVGLEIGGTSLSLTFP